MRENEITDDEGGPPVPHKGSFWLRESPYFLLLLLTLAGVAYWSFANTPIIGYWMFLAVLNAVVCIASGWQNVDDKAERFELVWSQIVHWFAVLVAMNILLLPNVAGMANVDATGQFILLVLALGTFLAGVHVPSWQLRWLGLVMAVCVPALAMLEESALILLLVVFLVAAVGGLIWWRLRGRHPWNAGVSEY